MFVNRVSYYLPSQVVGNDHFEKLNGLSNDWIIERTGIKERRKARAQENTNTMAIEALKAGLDDIPYDISEIDLIVGATYTAYDLIVTVAHEVQNYLGLENIPVVTVSSACSSLLNAYEVVEGYFALGKATKALVITSEHNTAYNDDQDKMSGHLWGDGAAVSFLSKDRITENDKEVIQIITGGAGNLGKATEAVVLRPNNGGISMPNGRDVFINACQYMSKMTLEVLEKNDRTIDDLDYLIPHQANLRIVKNVAASLNINGDKTISNVQYLGNTGCAGSAIALAEKWDDFKKGDNIVVTVFGGGYSYGSMLLQC